MLIAWGTDDIYFDLKWSHWLEEAIPGTKKRMELKGARIFFPEERAHDFNEAVRSHWIATPEFESIRCRH
jgi:pimeloyl-ACP methyl ester carboxylesterase